MMREVRREEVCSSQRVGAQLTESAGVDVHDEFSWC